MKPGEMICLVYRPTGKSKHIYHLHLPRSTKDICPSYLDALLVMKDEQNPRPCCDSAGGYPHDPWCYNYEPEDKSGG